MLTRRKRPTNAELLEHAQMQDQLYALREALDAARGERRVADGSSACASRTHVVHRVRRGVQVHRMGGGGGRSRRTQPLVCVKMNSPILIGAPWRMRTEQPYDG